MSRKQNALSELEKFDANTVAIARMDNERRSVENHSLYELREDSQHFHLITLFAYLTKDTAAVLRDYARRAHAAAFYYEYCNTLMSKDVYCSESLFNLISTEAFASQAVSTSLRKRILAEIERLED